MKNIAMFPRGSEVNKHDLVYVENVVHCMLLVDEKIKEGSPIGGEVIDRIHSGMIEGVYCLQWRTRAAPKNIY